MANKLLVLEAEWSEESTSHASKLSVLPMLDCVCRVTGTIMHHHVFHDSADIQTYLKRFCRELKSDDRAVIYLASHGGRRSLSATKRVHFAKIAKIINASSRNAKVIEGCLIGACETGNHDEAISTIIKNSRVRWVAGYKHWVDWIEGTLIDCSILSKVFRKQELDVFNNREEATLCISSWLSLINPFSEVAEDRQERPITAFDTIVVYYQLVGQGQRVSRLEGEELFPLPEPEFT